jgi:membrane-associated protease RseP (regulator of RpoE activity)
MNKTEFVVALFLLERYVVIPQLADLHEIEGKFDLPEDMKLITCFHKVIIAFVGQLVNMLLAFVLAIIVYSIGLLVLEEGLTTHVGYVTPKLTLLNGSQVKSPAFKAGILPNDKILSIYGRRIKKFDEIVQFTALGNKRTVVTSHYQPLNSNAIVKVTINRKSSAHLRFEGTE